MTFIAKNKKFKVLLLYLNAFLLKLKNFNRFFLVGAFIQVSDPTPKFEKKNKSTNLQVFNGIILMELLI